MKEFIRPCGSDKFASKHISASNSERCKEDGSGSFPYRLFTLVGGIAEIGFDWLKPMLPTATIGADQFRNRVPAIPMLQP